jgi:PAS domain-containing protein
MEITKYRSQLFAGSEQVMVYLRQAQNTLTRLGRTVADKPRRLQEALRARENDLRDVLVSSLDPIVVTDVGWRFVAANPQGLDLFGVSETNMRMFNINAFIRIMGRTERHGQCTIKRLDGSLRVADYIFVANCVPYRHLCKFGNAKTPRITLLHQTFNLGRPQHPKRSNNWNDLADPKQW